MAALNSVFDRACVNFTALVNSPGSFYWGLSKAATPLSFLY